MGGALLNLPPRGARSNGRLRRHRHNHRPLPHVHARNPLLVSLAATSHNPHPLHDPRLRLRLFHLLRLLPACDLLGGPAGLLRGVRHCKLFHPIVPLSGKGFA